MADTLLDCLLIRLGGKVDLPALEWEGEYVHFRRLYADVYQMVEEGRGLIWLAEIHPNFLVGQLFVALQDNRPELADGLMRAYVFGFRIRQAYRNQGIGTHTMQVVEEDLIQRGFRYVTLNVSRDNPGARRLYERLGYVVIAAEPGCWHYIDHHGVRQEVNEPAWRMEKRLFKLASE